MIEDFCRAGFAVSTPGGASTPRFEVDVSRGTERVMVAFRLPGDGRQVRARTLLKHLRREGSAVRMGLFFQQSHPAIMKSLLAESLEQHGDSRTFRAAKTSHLRASAEARPANAFAPLSSADEARIDHLIPELCEIFFRHANARLLARYKKETKHPEAFFRGLVAVHGLQGQLEARLRGCSTPTVAGIRVWLAKILRGLEVSSPVEDELLGILDDTLNVMRARD